MTLLVEKAAFLMSIQDSGRFGYQRFGMPESGPIDWWAFRGANSLLGNASGCACLEIGLTSSELLIEADTIMVVCGVGYRLFINQQEIPLWMVFIARHGDRLRVGKVSGGNWVYLAVTGGIQSPSWMGSQSVLPRARIGRLIVDGDRVQVPELLSTSRMVAGRTLSPAARPKYQVHPTIRVIPGPHQDCFLEKSLQMFWDQAYVISPLSDRMGYRLAGPSLIHSHGADLVSQGLVQGEIQVPADGQPIVMMPDHPTTGGYTSIGTVAKVDLPLLAQAQPEISRLRFEICDVSVAQRGLERALDCLDSAAQTQEEEWLSL